MMEDDMKIMWEVKLPTKLQLLCESIGFGVLFAQQYRSGIDFEKF